MVFLFAIKKFDLKTPGREDDDIDAEKKVELESNDYTAIAAKILEGCGGKENITSIDNCVTRLRLEVKDITAVNDKVIKSAGVAGVIKPGKTSVQVIIGTKVQFVADEFTKLCSSDEFIKAMKDANLTPACESGDEYQAFVDRKTDLFNSLKDYLLAGEK